MKHLAQEALQAVACAGTCCCPCPTFHESAEQRITTCSDDESHSSRCTFVHVFLFLFPHIVHYVFTHDRAGDCMQVQEAPVPHQQSRTAQKRRSRLFLRVFIGRHHLYAASLCSLQPKPIRHRAPGLKETLSVNLYVLTKRLTAPEERDTKRGHCVKHSVCSRVTG